MPFHWTDFPERVEKFGDLFNIFETLDHDVSAGGLGFEHTAKESPLSAYRVEYHPRPYLLTPRPERIPGWDELATFTERYLGFPPSLVTLRQVRSQALGVLEVPIAAVNEMTILAVVEVLTEASRQPANAEGGADFLLDNYRWLKVTEIAKLLALNPGQVSKYADTGTFVTNGKTGHDRRIDVLSAVRWELDRLARQDTAPGSA